MKVMLLAAGLGTRLRPVTDTYAKPAVPFLNIPLLYYPFSLLEAVGVSSLIVNTHHKPEQVERAARSIPGYAGQVHVTHEPGQPLGSGGGVWNARKWLEDEPDFLVANGDEVIFPSRADIAVALMQAHRETGALATLYVMRHPEAGSRFGAVWTDPNGEVRAFGKTRPAHVPASTIALHYVGVLALSRRVFEYLPEGESNLLYDALIAGIHAGESVRVFEDTCAWFETGNIADFLGATRTVMTSLGTHREPPLIRSMLQRFRPHDELQISADARCLVGQRVTVPSSLTLRGFVVLGDDCHIGGDCFIQNSVLLPGANLRDKDHLRDSILVL